MKKVIRSMATLLAAVVLLSACGVAASSGPSTFVSHDQSGAMAISWTDDGSGHLVGSLQDATPNATGAGALVETQDVSFTGTLHSGQISIVTNGFLGITSTWTGSLSGDSLTLNIPQAPNGSIAAATFTRGQVSDYNSAVAELDDQVTTQRSQAASEAASAAALAVSASASAAAASALADANQQVSTAAAALQGSLSNGLSFASFDSDMTTLKTDLETTRSEALKATTAGPTERANMDACGDASTAQGDASTVSGDQSTIGGDQSTAQATIDSVTQQAQDLGTAQAALKAVYQQQGMTPSTSAAQVLILLNQAQTATMRCVAPIGQ